MRTGQIRQTHGSLGHGMSGHAIKQQVYVVW